MWWLLIPITFLWWWSARGGMTVGQSTIPQLPGAAGIVQTAGLMKSMINEAMIDPLIRKQAVMATQGCERRDFKSKAVAIGEWTRRRIKYVPDPLGHEHLTNPSVIAKAIEQGKVVYGDCDDMTMYVGALGKSIGLPATLQVVGRNKHFHHVYVDVAGVPIDATVSFGTQPFDAKRRITLEV